MEAVEFGDVVMVIVPYTAMEQIGKDHGSALAKKALVIDVSNPIAQRDGAEIVKWVDDQGGAGLATAKFLPGAHIVRAFNAINYAKLSADAHRPGELVGVPIAGGDPHAMDIASSLIREIGFDPVVIGGLEMGKYLVPGTQLGGEHTAAEIRQIVPNLLKRQAVPHHSSDAWDQSCASIGRHKSRPLGNPLSLERGADRPCPR